ncbi:hypothetical protein ER308_20495 [Egibacter rhizosphaerae]|uniref:DAGKc domain-containing protein n=1 Tax=Egibacter rhizosphaerae TaxID=1670831 RepID=A0A411YKK6_9ACTN|nr:diacylglycerol kinase family protein [Egibacter rhizosphaerae]QBI21711.1 hypothetical protein ER308_20495 [Egibacter rhizosphaerae]
MSRPGPFRLLVNPTAGAGRARAVASALRDELGARGADADIIEEADRAGTERAARKSLDEGWRHLVAVGGDGTVQAVVNGMVADDQPVAEDAVLGIVPAGHGGDYARTFGLSLPPKQAVGRLLDPTTMSADLGVAETTNEDGGTARRYFVNLAEVGYGAEVAHLASRLPRRLGRVRYLLAAWGAIRGVDRQPTVVEIRHGQQTVDLVDLVIAKGQFFGGGMRVAPRALPDSGRFNVLAFTGQRSQVFTLTPQLYRGGHLPHPEIREWQSPFVAVPEPAGRRVEADGELLGRTPARFSLLPGILRISV